LGDRVPLTLLEMNVRKKEPFLSMMVEVERAKIDDATESESSNVRLFIS